MRRRHFLWLLTLAGLVVLAAAGTFALWPRRAELPRPEEVMAMHLRIYEDDNYPQDREYDVAPEHFAPLLSALEPYSEDLTKSTWIHLAYIQATLGDGSQCHIVIYSIERSGESDSESAFYVERPGRRRTFYRGGTDKAIKVAVRAAGTKANHS
jgi:hypothetical protein